MGKVTNVPLYPSDEASEKKASERFMQRHICIHIVKEAIKKGPSKWPLPFSKASPMVGTPFVKVYLLGLFDQYRVIHSHRDSSDINTE